jgi:hypothetical protein
LPRQALEFDQLGLRGKVASPQLREGADTGCGDRLRGGKLLANRQRYLQIGIAKNAGQLWKNLVAQRGELVLPLRSFRDEFFTGGAEYG